MFNIILYKVSSGTSLPILSADYVTSLRDLNAQIPAGHKFKLFHHNIVIYLTMQ